LKLLQFRYGYENYVTSNLCHTVEIKSLWTNRNGDYCN
jgi:hypothetical protein